MMEETYVHIRNQYYNGNASKLKLIMASNKRRRKILHSIRQCKGFYFQSNGSKTPTSDFDVTLMGPNSDKVLRCMLNSHNKTAHKKTLRETYDCNIYTCPSFFEKQKLYEWFPQLSGLHLHTLYSTIQSPHIVFMNDHNDNRAVAASLLAGSHLHALIPDNIKYERCIKYIQPFYTSLECALRSPTKHNELMNAFYTLSLFQIDGYLSTGAITIMLHELQGRQSKTWNGICRMMNSPGCNRIDYLCSYIENKLKCDSMSVPKTKDDIQKWKRQWLKKSKYIFRYEFALICYNKLIDYDYVHTIDAVSKKRLHILYTVQRTKKIDMRSFNPVAKYYSCMHPMINHPLIYAQKTQSHYMKFQNILKSGLS